VPQITAIDLAGNKTTVSGTPFSVKLNASAGIAHTTVDDTGTSSTDNVTTNPTPVIEGKVPGDTTLLKVLLNGVTYVGYANQAAAKADAVTNPALKFVLSEAVNDSGSQVRSYSFTTQALPHSNGNKYVPLITATIGGVPGTINGTPFEVDRQGPAVQNISGGVQPDVTNDTGLYSFDAITKNTTPTLSGTGEPGAAVSVAIKNAAGTVVQTLAGTVGSSGTWSLLVPAELSGSGANGQTYTPVITLTDSAGNPSTINGKVFTVDTTAPVAPVDATKPRLAGGLSDVSDNGTSTTDNITSVATPLLKGRAEAGAKVVVSINVGGGTQTYPETYADPNGDWQVAVPSAQALVNGTFTPSIQVTDVAGNLSTYNGTPFTVLVNAPKVAVTLTDANAPTTLKLGQSLGVKFSFDTDPGTSFSLDDVSVSNGSMSGLSSQSAVTNPADGKVSYEYTATFTPLSGVQANSAEVLRVLSDRFFDLAGNANKDGLDNNNAVSIALDTLVPTVSITSSVSAVKLQPSRWFSAKRLSASRSTTSAWQQARAL
jgi:hypothetical protein